MKVCWFSTGISSFVACYKSGRHILQSYDPYLGDNEGIGNTCV